MGLGVRQNNPLDDLAVVCWENVSKRWPQPTRYHVRKNQGASASLYPTCFDVTNRFAEEKPYWDASDKRAQHHQRGPPASSSSRSKSNDEGFLSKFSVVEIGNVCGNLAKNVGDQAKHFGGQAKLLGGQAKGYTLANTATAAATVDRFKKQVVAAVDGVPVRPDEDSLRENGTTTKKVELDGACEALLLVGSTEGGSCSDAGGVEGSEGEEEDNTDEKNKPQYDSAKKSNAGPTSVLAAGTSKRRDQLNGGMVDENGPGLGLGALAAAFKRKPVGGAAIAKAAGGERPLGARSGGSIPSDGSCADASGGGHHCGTNGDPAAVKLLPRTASLVGGKQWAVVSAVYDTTASIVDETVGDLFT